MRSSNLTCAAWKSCCGSGRGNTLFSVPACWNQCSTFDIGTFLWRHAFFGRTLPCRNCAGSTTPHSPPGSYNCPEEEMTHPRDLYPTPAGVHHTIQAVLPCSSHPSVWEGSPVRSHRPGLESCSLRSCSSQRRELDPSHLANFCTRAAPDEHTSD